MPEQTLDTTELGSGMLEAFLALRGLATITMADTGTVVCRSERFHWNGYELVICACGPAAWSGLVDTTVEVSLAAGDLRFQFMGGGSTDRVVGVAPEYREQLVRYLGPTQGHAAADSVGRDADSHRFFVTPRWNLEGAGR